jgi:hypothetical protein
MPENDCEAIAEIIRTNGNYALPNEEISEGWSSEEQPAAYYRTTAARARRLQADVTTPRVKQYLDKMIVHCDRLAGKAEQPASRPLDRPAASTNPGERSVHRLVQFRIAE